MRSMDHINFALISKDHEERAGYIAIYKSVCSKRRRWSETLVLEPLFVLRISSNTPINAQVSEPVSLGGESWLHRYLQIHLLQA